ncbi:MAG: hypothetical protein V7641_789 [Blastocatellia bacterium]
MKVRIINLSKAMSVIVFIAGIVFFTGSKLSSRQPSSKSYSVTYQVSSIQNGSPPIVEMIQIRTAKATGEYKTITYHLGSGKITEVIATKDSVYNIKTDSLQFLGLAWPPETRKANISLTSDTSNPGFVREEKVCGLTTYVYHTQNGDSWADQYFAVGIVGTPLKSVVYEGDGSYRIIEAINVQFRDILDDEMNLPDLPIKFDEAEVWLSNLQNNGANEITNTLKQQIDMEKHRLGIQ